MKRGLVVSGIVLLLVSVIAIGCSSGVSQEKYDTLLGNLTQAQQDLATANAELSSTQATLSDTQATLSSTQSELNALKEKCPPGDFATVSELQTWANNHKQTKTQYADDWFRGCLQVQEAGLEDGYMISVDIDYDSSTGTYTIGCNAFAGGSYYWWNPESPILYPYDSTFRR
jgi:hypothetical protein